MMRLLQRTLDKLPEQFCLPDDIPVYVQKVYAEPEECEKMNYGIDMTRI